MASITKISKTLTVAVAMVALSLTALPTAGAADAVVPPTNTITAHQQAVIDFQNSLAGYIANKRSVKDAFRAQLTTYRATMQARQLLIRPLVDARIAGVVQANLAFATAIASATTAEARDSIIKTRTDAIAATRAAFEAGITALQAAPTKPAKPLLPTKPIKPVKPTK